MTNIVYFKTQTTVIENAKVNNKVEIYAIYTHTHTHTHTLLTNIAHAQVSHSIHADLTDLKLYDHLT